jgi:hypothetical protein
MTMGRTHSEIMAALPEERRRKIAARTQELVTEVEGLKALRQLAARRGYGDTCNNPFTPSQGLIPFSRVSPSMRLSPARSTIT